VREKGTNRSQFFRGEVDKYTWVDIGSSYLPSELVGAFLWAQLEHAAEVNARRLASCAAYRAGLADLAESGLIELPQPAPAGATPNGHMFYILARSLAERTALLEHLKSQGIYAVFHYVPLHASPAGRRFGRAAGELPVTDDVSSRLVRLPLYYELSAGDIDQVVGAVKSFFSRKR